MLREPEQRSHLKWAYSTNSTKFNGVPFTVNCKQLQHWASHSPAPLYRHNKSLAVHASRAIRQLTFTKWFHTTARVLGYSVRLKKIDKGCRWRHVTCVALAHCRCWCYWTVVEKGHKHRDLRSIVTLVSECQWYTPHVECCARPLCGRCIKCHKVKK